MTKTEIIVDNRGELLVVEGVKSSSDIVGFRHHDINGQMHVWVDVSRAVAVESVSLDLFGPKPWRMTTKAFNVFRTRYTNGSGGLGRYMLLKEYGIPFTRHEHLCKFLDDPKYQFRSTLADLLHKYDLEDEGALLLFPRKKKKKLISATSISPTLFGAPEQKDYIDLSDYNGRHLTGRWFVFGDLEDAVLAKLKFGEKEVQPRIIELRAFETV